MNTIKQKEPPFLLTVLSSFLAASRHNIKVNPSHCFTAVLIMFCPKYNRFATKSVIYSKHNAAQIMIVVFFE